MTKALKKFQANNPTKIIINPLFDDHTCHSVNKGKIESLNLACLTFKFI